MPYIKPEKRTKYEKVLGKSMGEMFRA